ncbi:MAG TPA: hypothetical protein VMZ53_08030 [Kofleriaceae bacterium]|nr:hypothetical protein [Kofleriaceae bacterium]
MGECSTRRRVALVAAVALAGCAKANSGGTPDAGPGESFFDAAPDATCGNMCDHDHDGVFDPDDKCANTPMGQVVNGVGCADSQLTPTLVPFPPFGLTWTPTGDLGRAAKLTWTYVGIDRKDLFHIYWLVCDDPATPCGLSLDGPIDVAAEQWQYSATGSDLPNGKLVFTNATHISLANGTSPALDGRLTITIVDATDVAIPFATVAGLSVTPLAAAYGAEIKGAGFKVVVTAEVLDTTTATYKPYLDYYDAAPTPATGASTATSFGGSFYAK